MGPEVTPEFGIGVLTGQKLTMSALGPGWVKTLHHKTPQMSWPDSNGH